MAGVVGWPVEHSLSPRLHNYWLEQYVIDGAYVPLPVKRENLEFVLRALPRMGFAGCNVTVPHKETAARVVDHLTPQAKRLGAVNTVIVRDDGSLEGRNTDGYGFIQNLMAASPDWQAGSGPAVVFGAGGAARSIVPALMEEGAQDIRIVNRTLQKAEKLCKDLAMDRVALRPCPFEMAPDALEDAALVVNTTALGMTGYPQLNVDLDTLPVNALVTDIVYNPLITSLLERAEKRGNRIVDGLGMLIHQARPGFNAWFGREPEVTRDLKSYLLGTLNNKQKEAS